MSKIIKIIKNIRTIVDIFNFRKYDDFTSSSNS